MHILLLLLVFAITPSILFSSSQYHVNANSPGKKSLRDSSLDTPFDSKSRYKFADPILKDRNIYIRGDLFSSLRGKFHKVTKTEDNIKPTDNIKTTENIKTIKSTDDAKTTESTDSAKTTESTDSAKTINSAKTTESVTSSSESIKAIAQTTQSLDTKGTASQYKDSDSGSTQSVPTEPMSIPTIAALVSIGGAFIVVAGIFALVRRKRHKEMADNIVATSAVAWKQQNDAYEQMEEGESQSLGTYTVVATYTPSLADELVIQPGDKVTILMEYDDGWVQGINESRGGTKGVFPRHCVDMNSAFNNKRSSSMGGYTVVDLN